MQVLFMNQMEINDNFKYMDHNYSNGYLLNGDTDDTFENDDDVLESDNIKLNSNKIQINGMDISCLLAATSITQASLPQTIQSQTTTTPQVQSTNTNDLKSIMNYCEEQIKENDEIKKLNLRRATSVKVTNIKGCLNSSSSDEDCKKPEKKVVRFADALGLDLVKIKMILNPDRPPHIPKHILKLFRDAAKYSDEDDDENSEDDENENDDDCYFNQFSDFNNNNSNRNSYINSILFNKFNTKPFNGRTINGISTTKTTTTKTSPNKNKNTNTTNDNTFLVNNCKHNLKWLQLFDQPGLRPDFFIKLNEKKVSLETIHIKAHLISGIIRVSNISYNKNVKLRYTIDKWATYTDINAAYINNSCDGFSDRFSFNFNLESQLADYFNVPQNLNNTFKIEFAVLYETKLNDYELNSYWDNNYNANYLIECVNKSLSPSQSANDLINDFSNNLSAAFV